jgi:hypothetical protein
MIEELENSVACELFRKQETNKPWEDCRDNPEDLDNLVNELFGHSHPKRIAIQNLDDLSFPSNIQARIKGTDSTASARNYRRETADLIKKLDGLVNSRNPPSSIDLSAKSKRRFKATVQFKPRARNVVMKEAVEMVWKLQCDEMVSESYNDCTRILTHDNVFDLSCRPFLYLKGVQQRSREFHHGAIDFGSDRSAL